MPSFCAVGRACSPQPGGSAPGRGHRRGAGRRARAMDGGCGEAEFFCLLSRIFSALSGQRPGGQAAPPSETIAAWLALLAVVVVGPALLVVGLRWAVRRGVRAALRERTGGAGPRTYWQCASCRAAYPLTAERCYSCGGRAARPGP